MTVRSPLAPDAPPSLPTERTNSPSLKPTVTTKRLSHASSPPKLEEPTTTRRYPRKCWILPFSPQWIVDIDFHHSCCLQSRPPGPDACMCTHQQSSSATCLLDGVCLGAATCSRKSSLICTGTSKAKPSKYCLTPGALACTGSATKEVDTSWSVLFVHLVVDVC